MKMFRALTEAVCEKQFGPELVPGWFATTQEALAAFAAPVSEQIASSTMQNEEPRTKRPYNRKKAT